MAQAHALKIERTSTRTAGTVAKPQPAPGVVYSEHPSAPGLKVFACEPHRMTLSMGGCARRWSDAQQATGKGLEETTACRRCPIGAAHAGADFTVSSPIFGLPICPRCRKGTTRMIQNRVCVTCRNREYELASGRNARGNPPSDRERARAPRPLGVSLVVDGVPAPRQLLATDMLEVMLQTLRTTRGDVAFGWAPGNPQPAQGRMLL